MTTMSTSALVEDAGDRDSIPPVRACSSAPLKAFQFNAQNLHAPHFGRLTPGIEKVTDNIYKNGQLLAYTLNTIQSHMAVHELLQKINARISEDGKPGYSTQRG